MKSFLSYILLSLIPMFGISQTKKVFYKDTSDSSYQTGYVNKLGQKDSCWISYDKSGNILSKANFKNGSKNGEWVIYDERGNIIFELNYSNGVLVSGKRWDSNGNLVEEKKNVLFKQL